MTLQVATTVKLMRIAMVSLVVMLVSRCTRTSQAPNARRSALSDHPWFLWLFLVMATLSNVGALNPAAKQWLEVASRAFIVSAVVGHGAQMGQANYSHFEIKSTVLLVTSSIVLASFTLAYASALA